MFDIRVVVIGNGNESVRDSFIFTFHRCRAHKQCASILMTNYYWRLLFPVSSMQMPSRPPGSFWITIFPKYTHHRIAIIWQQTHRQIMQWNQAQKINMNKKQKMETAERDRIQSDPLRLRTHDDDPYLSCWWWIEIMDVVQCSVVVPTHFAGVCWSRYIRKSPCCPPMRRGAVPWIYPNQTSDWRLRSDVMPSVLMWIRTLALCSCCFELTNSPTYCHTLSQNQ